MFIGLIKTTTNQIAKETETLEEAWDFLHCNTENCEGLVRAVVLEETEDSYLDDQYPDFNSLKEVAAMRIVR